MSHNNKKILLVGDIVVDVSLPTNQSEIKVRLGGVVHAARGLWAMGTSYSVAFIAPKYLEHDIERYLIQHGCNSSVKIGDVNGAPYVFLINEVKEAGDQGYDFLLRDQISLNIDYKLFSDFIAINNFTDVLIISGNFKLTEIVNCFEGKNERIYIDVANNVDNLEEFRAFKHKLEAILISTSSEIFRKNYFGDFIQFATLFEPFANNVVLKENRGGSRAYIFESKSMFKIPSQTRPIVHSVGVGDVYNACLLSQYPAIPFENALHYSSWVAAEYASTTFVNDFKKEVTSILKRSVASLVDLGGVSLPWETRQSFNIYIAAPDFDYMDTSKIELLARNLRYHNFTPRLPVRENGQMQPNPTKQHRQNLFLKDMEILAECQLLIAVLLNDDPGTYIEIGIAYERRIPVLVYDPFNKAYNCMLTEVPLLVSNDMDEIISEVFTQMSKS